MPGSDVALVGPTSNGISLVAEGLAWQPGDHLLYCHEDYPSNAIPWMRLRERGVEVEALQTSAPGHVLPETVADQVRPNTRLVAVSSQHFLTGFRTPIEAIAEVVHSHFNNSERMPLVDS